MDERPRSAETSIEPDRSPLSIQEIVVLAVALGLAAGFVEVLAVVVNQKVKNSYLMISSHYIWMIPLANLIESLFVSIFMIILSRVFPRISPRFVAFTLIAAAILNPLQIFPIRLYATILVAAGISARLVAWIHPRRVRFGAFVADSTWRLIGLLMITIAYSFGVDAWERTLETFRAPPGEGAPNVLLIVMDTVRAKELSLYGYDRDTTPNLKKLAERGVVFDRAFASAPWTAPSHASMFTGEIASRCFPGFRSRLDRSIPTIAESTRSLGYRTAGFVANLTFCSRETGLNRGFSHYEDYPISLMETMRCSLLFRHLCRYAHFHFGAYDLSQSPVARKNRGPFGFDYRYADQVNASFLSWVDRGSRPFFAFLNYFDAHLAYLPPPDRPSRFLKTPLESTDIDDLMSWWDADKSKLTKRQYQLNRDGYDECIASIDDAIGRLIDELDRRGLMEKTVVIIASDHGEHFGERELFGHACSLYTQETLVPLLIIDRRIAARGLRVRDPVGLRDIARTIADLTGSPDRPSFPGRSLVPYWKEDPGSRSNDAPPIMIELSGPPDELANQGRSPIVIHKKLSSIIVNKYQYILGEDGVEELYDLDLDIENERDLAPNEVSKPRLAEMRAILDRERANPRATVGKFGDSRAIARRRETE
jgi:arylsulfatase A-like enzyme